MYKTLQWTAISLKRNVLTRSYEPVQPFLFAALAERIAPDIVLDVGANIGIYSLFVAGSCPKAAIHAFEPAPETFSELQSNIALNGLQDRVKAHQVAASDAAGQVSFGIVDAASGANSVQNTSIHAQDIFASHQMVDACPLDALIQEVDRTIFMKVDVEGHENNVLLGARKLLDGNRVLLQIEDYQALDVASLTSLGFEPLLALGPDRYFTNHKAAFTDALLLEALQTAVGCNIQENLNPDKRVPGGTSSSPLELPLVFGISLRVRGPIARALRTLKQGVKGAAEHAKS